MARITVEKAFTLHLDHGPSVRFPVGEHDVDDAIAAHWYVQAHSTPVADKVPAAPKDQKAEKATKGKG
jgi:hypothetical protein